MVVCFASNYCFFTFEWLFFSIKNQNYFPEKPKLFPRKTKIISPKNHNFFLEKPKLFPLPEIFKSELSGLPGFSQDFRRLKWRGKVVLIFEVVIELAEVLAGRLVGLVPADGLRPEVVLTFIYTHSQFVSSDCIATLTCGNPAKNLVTPTTRT